ncbi:hypothetical protein B0H67DRAFT_536609 [Lasiosphaeris hirsuta]|uniref:DUF6546 domain-containing protein n=1 Tax=Lasiosphaeris hirsuta TaxID=260670 RepID=A0AA40DWV9_9PEZI|nr:hypothetical protein B0H67DRAFT_536609 [Lasiosphaeris hirsuta]
MDDRSSATEARRHGMTLRGSTRQLKDPVCWTSLPAEVHLMILDTIAKQKHPGWASFASVCKEWQYVIERQNFRRLNLRVSCLDDFERIVVRQRELVRHICLDIELRKYTCRSCQSEDFQRTRRDEIYTKGVKEIYRILGTWKLAKNGLTLELNAYSPSDSKHWFKNWYFTSSDEGIREADCNWHDPDHGWIDGRQLIAPPNRAVSRLFGILHLTLSFSKRHRTETWIAVLIRLVQHGLPQTLKRISVFEDFSDDIAAAYRRQTVFVSASRIVQPQLGAAFAARSRDLEQLSVSYMVNAQDFFQACQPAWTWARLESLALTSQHFQDPGRRDEVDALLFKAGVTALRMPKLRALVLWDGRKDNACAFVYRTGGDHASVTWLGTWNMDLSPRVVEAWRRVAFDGHSRHTLRTDNQEVRGVINSHGDAIYRLKLPCQVVSPTSLWQIREENVDRSLHKE